MITGTTTRIKIQQTTQNFEIYRDVPLHHLGVLGRDKTVEPGQVYLESVVKPIKSGFRLRHRGPLHVVHKEHYPVRVRETTLQT